MLWASHFRNLFGGVVVHHWCFNTVLVAWPFIRVGAGLADCIVSPEYLCFFWKIPNRLLRLFKPLFLVQNAIQREKIGGSFFTYSWSFLLTVGAFLLTVELLCLKSVKVLIRRTFPL